MLRAFLIVLASIISTSVLAVNYPIVAVRAPRAGDDTHTPWQEVFHPFHGQPGTDLVIIHPDGSEEVLVDAGDVGMCFDPSVSLDGQWVYYAFCEDKTSGNGQRKGMPTRGADIYKIHVETREIVRLTHQEWTPTLGVTEWNGEASGELNHHKGSNPDGAYLGYGIWNSGPVEVPGGRVIFTSSRNGYVPPKGFTFPNMQLYAMDTDGANVEQVGYLNIGSALHPQLMQDGRIMWSSYESQGLRDRRLWGLWYSYPDGREWGPLMSAFLPKTALHFQAEKSDGRVVVTAYYNGNDEGFGTILEFPPTSDIPEGVPDFGSPRFWNNTPVWSGYARRMVERPISGFQPWGLETLTAFTHFNDRAAFLPGDETDDAKRVGKITHPSAGPDGLLMVYTPGPANNLNRPTNKPFYQGKIAWLSNDAREIQSPGDLVILAENSSYNYQQPRALLSWEAIYGSPPQEREWLPNDGRDERLRAGTPFGLIGTSSFYNRNTSGNGQDGMRTQGGNVGEFENSDMHAVRIIQTEPQSHISYLANGLGGLQGWRNKINERLRVMGEVAIHKEGDAVDSKGDPDTSFLAKVPADVPFTFQVVDSEGLALIQAQTWHQIRPGERRVNCGGCHAHNEQPVPFEGTVASQPDYSILDATGEPRDYEFRRDVLPILQEKCQTCHDENHVVLDLTTRPYAAVDQHSFPLRARLSYLVHKIRGETETGETVEGMPMPPADAPQLTDAEKRIIYAWIDTGMSVGEGVFIDNVNPTLTIQSPRRNEVASTITIGAFDNDSRLNRESLRVVLNEEDITDQFTENDWIWTAALAEPVESGVLHVEVFDQQGNKAFLDRSFSGSLEDDEIERLKERIVVLEQTISELQSKIEEAIRILE